MNDKETKQLIENAAARLANHEYIELVNANGVEVWRCQQPGTRNLQFDICVTPLGMSVFGDIDGLIWSVGSNYGISFLRNGGLGRLHEMLEKQSKEVEIDKESIFESVIDCIVSALEERELPEPDCGRGARSFIKWLEVMSEGDEEKPAPYEEWLDLLKDIDRLDEGTDRDAVAAYDLVTGSEQLLEASDLFEISYTKPTKSLWQRLCYVSHAATAIMAIQETRKLELSQI